MSANCALGLGNLRPMDWFWSPMLHDAEITGMVPNPLERYSIGYPTEGVKCDDGSFTLTIGHSESKIQLAILRGLCSCH